VLLVAQASRKNEIEKASAMTGKSRFIVRKIDSLNISQEWFVFGRGIFLRKYGIFVATNLYLSARR
jgi:hypothetical protein